MKMKYLQIKNSKKKNCHSISFFWVLMKQLLLKSNNSILNFKL